mmetsp:Transcript_14207/g.36810  ORF Transcript_14207/g.36810 Transcript_14207/m.36810 type:complete len:246 (-) Transcript_14207:130-867(-)
MCRLAATPVHRKSPFPHQLISSSSSCATRSRCSSCCCSMRPSSCSRSASSCSRQYASRSAARLALACSASPKRPLSWVRSSSNLPRIASTSPRCSFCCCSSRSASLSALAASAVFSLSYCPRTFDDRSVTSRTCFCSPSILNSYSRCFASASCLSCCCARLSFACVFILVACFCCSFSSQTCRRRFSYSSFWKPAAPSPCVIANPGRIARCRRQLTVAAARVCRRKATGCAPPRCRPLLGQRQVR